jgi:hypothetical protein
MIVTNKEGRVNKTVDFLIDLVSLPRTFFSALTVGQLIPMYQKGGGDLYPRPHPIERRNRSPFGLPDATSVHLPPMNWNMVPKLPPKR